MAAPITLATYLTNVVNAATARGVTDGGLQTVRTEAMDRWYSDLNASYSGEPRGSSAAN
jgi:hypothetical protein